MAFDRLQELGEDKFGKILNALMRGKPAMHLARLIQMAPPEGWGHFQDVQEKTLTQQLNRLRLAAASGAFGSAHAKRLAEGHTPHIDKLARVSVNVLTRLEELSEIQKDRVLCLVEKEKNMPTPTGQMLIATNAVFNDYKQLLMDIQKVRFDLGLDEFKGPVGGTHVVRGAMATQTFPDGSSIQKQVFEAVTTIEQIFDARKIPVVTAPTR